MAVEAKPPGDWSHEVRAGFEAFVRCGGEVAGAGLPALIDEAELLVCHFEQASLVAIAGLKKPRASYRTELRDRSGFNLAADTYPYEVGWVYVAPEYQGKKLSRVLVEACLEGCKGAGVFATTSTENVPMQKTLKRFGFVQVGKPYLSKRRKVSLILLVREPGAPKQSLHEMARA